MKIYLVLHIISLVLSFCVNSSDALFFSYPKNVLMNFFKSLHEKKEMKESPPDIHHYHLHYYPVHMSSIHATVTSSHKAPEKHDLDSLHTNKLESLGWGDQEYKYIPDPIIHHFPSFSSPWISTSHDSAESDEPWGWGEDSLDRQSRTGPGILFRAPIHQQKVQHKPAKKDIDQLSLFFQKIRNLQNSLYHQNRDTQQNFDQSSDKLKGFLLWDNSKLTRKL